MDRTKENIKEYYSNKSLGEEKVHLLLGKHSKKNRIWMLSKIAIAALLIMGFIFTIFQFQNSNIEDRIVKEIAMNHNKQLNVEFPSDSLSDLQTKLTKLDFQLDKAEGFISDNYILMGGRYCSIQGNLAAQLKIKNNHTNDFETLYITELNPDLENVESADVNTEGVNIKIWNEDGLLYGIASDI
ncbi:MAG: hypothetical protein DHS20C13_04540 [Thermodesulfobacteriota bacterium]|nr:MAG: hypothetical protein DHS20C13_04540 [Thermodesulfobacteriota bacterium]